MATALRAPSESAQLIFSQHQHQQDCGLRGVSLPSAPASSLHGMGDCAKRSLAANSSSDGNSGWSFVGSTSSLITNLSPCSGWGGLAELAVLMLSLRRLWCTGGIIHAGKKKGNGRRPQKNLIRVGVQLKRCQIIHWIWMSSYLRSCIPTRLVSICCVYQTPEADPRLRFQALAISRAPATMVAKGTHGRISVTSPTRAKANKEVEKERTKEGKASFPNSCLEGTTPTWTCMAVGCVSTIRLDVVQTQLMEQNVSVVGTCVAERDVSLHMLKKTMIRGKSDSSAASTP